MKKGEQTRQHIIEESALVFNRLGYGNTSMATLMEATGLEKGGIYRHFTSKEELACEAFDYTRRVAHEQRFEAANKAETGFGKVEKFIELFTTVTSKIPGGCPIFNTAVENNNGNNAVLKRKAHTSYNLLVGKVEAWMKQAQDEGQFKKNMNCHDMATFVVCSLEGAMIARYLTGDREILVKAGQQMLAFLKMAA